MVYIDTYSGPGVYFTLVENYSLGYLKLLPPIATIYSLLTAFTVRKISPYRKVHTAHVY